MALSRNFLIIDSPARTVLLGLVLVIAPVAVYWPVRGHPFCGLDDYLYVVNNLHVRSGLTWDTAKWALTNSYAGNWHPLSWVSHALDIQLFGLNPAGHHLENVLLHAIDAVLVFWVLLRATGYVGRSWMVAALFALHPINVEPVAWVAERKTMLSMLFFLLSLAAYRWYASNPTSALVVRAGKPSGCELRVGRYAVVGSFYVLGIMAKPQVITLPILLLLWDYWPLQRMFATTRESSSVRHSLITLPGRNLQWLLMEKLPLLLVCAGGALVTLHAQSKGIVTLSFLERLRPENWASKLPIRLENAIFAYAEYIGKAFWPSAMAPEYPQPGAWLTRWQILGASCFLLSITILVMANWRRRYLATGWLWFLISLVPMLGLVQAGSQGMADRYAYGSFLGLFVMVSWGSAALASQCHLPRVVLPAVSVLVLAALTTLTHRQVGYWKDDLTLWTHASQVVKHHWVAEDNVALALLARGKPEAEVMPHFYRAAQIQPLDPISNLRIAIYEQRRGDLSEAIADYKKAMASLDADRDSPTYHIIYQNMGVAYRDLGNSTKARECFVLSAAFPSHQ